MIMQQECSVIISSAQMGWCQHVNIKKNNVKMLMFNIYRAKHEVQQLWVKFVNDTAGSDQSRADRHIK